MPRPHTPRRRSSQQHHDFEDQDIQGKVAHMIQTARHEAQLTQAELAERIGTQQQAIARLEDPEYDGHSVRVLNRIAHAIGLKLSVSFSVAEDFE